MPTSYPSITPFYINDTGIAYDPDAVTYFTRVTAVGGSLTVSEKAAISAFVTGLKADGNWTNMFDRLGIMGVQNETAALVSLVNPSSTLITRVNAPTFTAGMGFTGNGLTNYLNLNYSALDEGVTFTLNSAAYGGYVRNNVASEALMGSTNPYSSLFPRYSGDSFVYGEINSATALSSVVTVDARGLTSVIRTSATATALYKGSTVVTTNNANAAVSQPRTSTVLCRMNFAGPSPEYFSTYQCPFYFYGSGSLNITAFNTRLNTLGTALGWLV